MKKIVLHLLIVFNLILVPSFAVTNAQFIDNEKVNYQPFSASSLDFELVNLHDEPVDSLFNHNWFKADNPLQQTIVVKNIGKDTFSYYPSFVFHEGNAIVCDNLRLTATHEGFQLYSGQLSEFTIPSLAVEHSGETDLWSFILTIQNDSETIQGQACHFDIVFSSVNSGFYDTETVSNSITLAVIPTLTANYNNENHTFSFNAKNLSTFSSLTYTLDYIYTYQGNEISDHFEETISLSSESENYTEILLGTCSETCTYHQNPKDFNLMIEFQHSGGHSVVLTKEL